MANEQAQRQAPRIGFLVLLKTFQCLGYFPKVADISSSIIRHIAKITGTSKTEIQLLAIIKDKNIRIRHIGRILNYLRVTAYCEAAEKVMFAAATMAATTKDDLADIINLSIEELVRQRYELPGFTTVLKSARKARSTINSGYHKVIYQALGEKGWEKIEALLESKARPIKSA